jgi:hypothetical protein
MGRWTSHLPADRGACGRPFGGHLSRRARTAVAGHPVMPLTARCVARRRLLRPRGYHRLSFQIPSTRRHTRPAKARSMHRLGARHRVAIEMRPCRLPRPLDAADDEWRDEEQRKGAEHPPRIVEDRHHSENGR